MERKDKEFGNCEILATPNSTVTQNGGRNRYVLGETYVWDRGWNLDAFEAKTVDHLIEIMNSGRPYYFFLERCSGKD